MIRKIVVIAAILMTSGLAYSKETRIGNFIVKIVEDNFDDNAKITIATTSTSSGDGLLLTCKKDKIAISILPNKKRNMEGTFVTAKFRVDKNEPFEATGGMLGKFIVFSDEIKDIEKFERGSQLAVRMNAISGMFSQGDTVELVFKLSQMGRVVGELKKSCAK